jgi:RNA polymerase sigma-70 factor (ECF subfamily)
VETKYAELVRRGPVAVGNEITETGLRSQIAGLLPDLRGFARFLAGDRAAADDLVQDGLVRALAALDQFQPGTNLKAWLFTIVRNAFYEGARRRKREVRALESQANAQEAASPAQEARADVRDLQALIWTLPPLLREALILVGAQEMTYEEAALVCNVPVGTVKARVSRGRAALAAAMRRAEGRGDEVHGVADT